MKFILNKILLAALFTGLWSISLAPNWPRLPTLATPAEARFGRPLTPVSVGGVARRTTRRVVVTESAAESEAAAAAASTPQAAPATAEFPAGTVVSALPAGCTSETVSGTSMFNCAGVMYQPKFQSNNLVYVVK